MSDTTALDYEAISKDLNAIQADVDLMLSIPQQVAMRIANFNSGKKEDVTVTTIANKISALTSQLKPIPEQIEELTRSLKQKSESIQELINETTSGIDDVF